MSAPTSISKWRQDRMKFVEEIGFPSAKKILQSYPLKGVDIEYLPSENDEDEKTPKIEQNIDDDDLLMTGLVSINTAVFNILFKMNSDCEVCDRFFTFLVPFHLIFSF